MITARRKRDELLGLLRPRFGRIEAFAQFRKYLAAVMSDLPECNGWSIAKFAGDRTPDKTQRLLNHASWDALEVMGVVRRFGADGLEAAARKSFAPSGYPGQVLIAVTPNGKTVYVASQSAGTVNPIRTASDTAGKAIKVGTDPFGLAITPNGKTVYVVNNGSGTVTPVGTGTNTAGKAINVGAAPVSIAITP